MGDIVSKSRYGQNFHDVLKRLPDFITRFAECFEALRASSFADVLGMYGPHGLAAVARALAEARNADDQFAPFFLPLALELTTILESLAEASPSRTERTVLPRM